MQKRTHIGASILKLSKVLMNKYVKNKYDDKAEFLFTDTDSLMYEIKSEIVYEGFYREKDYLTSAFIQKNQIIIIRQIT